MFNDSNSSGRRGAGFWLKVGSAVVILLLAYNFYRVNRTDAPPASPTPVPVQYTEGDIVNGRISIEPNAYLPYRFDLNHRLAISGNFRVAGKDPWITCLILDEANYEKWRSGDEFVAVNSTGRVPVGRVSRELEPGTYFLLFDNRSSREKFAVVDVSFSVE
jgi:hypothetical protein